MTMLSVQILYLLAGVCVYAAINHLSVGLQRPFDRGQLIFAAICLILIPFSLLHAHNIKASQTNDFIWSVRWTLNTALLFFVLFHWFIAAQTQIGPKWLLWTLSGLFVLLIIANTVLPYTLQYENFEGIRGLNLPWGERIAKGVGKGGIWAYFTIAVVFIEFCFVVFAVSKRYLKSKQFTDLCMVIAVGIFLYSAVHGILVRLSVIQSVSSGPLGFLLMIFIMSIACNRQARERLRQSERLFRGLVEQSPFSIQLMSPSGETLQVNPAWEKLWGVPFSHLREYNVLQDEQLVSKGIMPYIEQGFSGIHTEIPPIVYDASNSSIKGPMRDQWIRAHIYPIKNQADAIENVVLMHEDVTVKKRAEEIVRLIAAGMSNSSEESLFQHLILNLAKLFDAEYGFIGIPTKNNPDQIDTLAVCENGKIIPNFHYNLKDTPCANVMTQSTCIFTQGIQNLFPKDQLLVEMNIESYIGTPLIDTQGEVIGNIVVLKSSPLEQADKNTIEEIMEIFAGRASTELRRLRAEKHIRHLAYYDYLTGLANRAQLHEQLSKRIKALQEKSHFGALILVDLDHFKTINDALSHEVGDQVLCAVGQTVNTIIGAAGLTARLGGDEFVVLLNASFPDKANAESTSFNIAQQLLNNLANPLTVGERTFTLGASIGVVLFPEPENSELDIMRHADMAMYHAKRLGRDNIQFYTPSMQKKAAERLSLEDGLRQAISNNELSLAFQPQVNAQGAPIGAEVLLRWTHPSMGNIPPDVFIKIAEETGLITNIGKWVLEQACKSLRSWSEQKIQFDGYLSVNISPWQFNRTDLVDQIKSILNNHQIDPNKIFLEITESAFLYDIEEAKERLTQLRSAGLKIALDDFGTGYSSLAYLRDLPLDQLKIDKSFIQELTNSDHPLIESMISISKHMDLPLVAEGVETATQKDLLIQLGTEKFQGYFFCKPLPESEFLNWLTGRR